MSIGVGGSKDDQCKECKGTVYTAEKTKCDNCEKGWVNICDFCGVDLEGDEVSVCSTCEENLIVIKLAQPSRYF